MQARFSPKRWAKVAAWVVVALMALVYVLDIPYVGSKGRVCPVCRASSSVAWFMFVPYRRSFENNEFSEYYVKYVDPNHRHTWLTASISYTRRTGETCGCGIPMPMLRYEAALAILKSLPGAQERKAFFEWLYIPSLDYRTPEGQRIRDIVDGLNELYRKNSSRADWPEQLRKLGAYPRMP